MFRTTTSYHCVCHVLYMFQLLLPLHCRCNESIVTNSVTTLRTNTISHTENENYSVMGLRSLLMPIVYHFNTIHSDTVSRCGVFCSFISTIECCKTEGIVDVFQVVKALRIQKPVSVLTVVSMSVACTSCRTVTPKYCSRNILGCFILLNHATTF